MVKALKIGFVLDDTIDSPDGVQQYVLTVGQWLERQGHEVHYLCGQSTRRDVRVNSLSRNLRVRFNGNRLSIPMPAKRQLISQLLVSQKFDVLHIQMPYSPWLAGRVIKLADKRQTALIGTFHIAPNGNVARIGARLLAVLTRLTSQELDTILAASPVAADFARRDFGLNCTVLPNCFKLSLFLSNKKLSTSTKNNQLTLLFLGRLVPRKGCQYLLAAILELTKTAKLPAFKVIIAGRGPQAAALKRFVRSNKLEKIIEFVGFIEESDKPGLLASADIAIFPSTGGESFGIILLEAMAACRGAVLAGNNPGYGGLMQGHADQLFNPKVAIELAAKLAFFMNNSSARRQAALWQKARAAAYDIESVGPKIVDIYQKALNKPTAVP